MSMQKNVFDFSCNNNILNTPREILRKIKKCDLSRPVDETYAGAVNNIASIHKTGAENIVIDNNIYSLISDVLKALKIRSASVVMPCENEYKNICRANACGIIPYILSERSNFKLSCDDFIEKITVKSDAVIIDNPSAITGRVISKSDMRFILDYCQSKGIYVIVNERYMDFVLNSQSCADMIDEYHNLVVLRSFSEYYNLSGVNSAYGVAISEICEIIKENQIPHRLDAVGLCLCENAMLLEKFDIKTKKWIFDNVNSFKKRLKEYKAVKAIHTDCHFMLMSLEDTSATTVHNRCLNCNIKICDASAFQGLDGSYIRIAVKDSKTNEKLLENLARCLI